MSCRLWVVAGLLALVGHTARAAPQATLFDDFTRNCASHAGDAAGALNAVSRQGWRMIPQQQL